MSWKDELFWEKVRNQAISRNIFTLWVFLEILIESAICSSRKIFKTPPNPKMQKLSKSVENSLRYELSKFLKFPIVIVKIRLDYLLIHKNLFFQTGDSRFYCANGGQILQKRRQITGIFNELLLLDGSLWNFDTICKMTCFSFSNHFYWPSWILLLVRNGFFDLARSQMILQYRSNRIIFDFLKNQSNDTTFFEF